MKALVVEPMIDLTQLRENLFLQFEHFYLQVFSASYLEPLGAHRVLHTTLGIHRKVI
jgi:hypothetical protein